MADKFEARHRPDTDTPGTDGKINDTLTQSEKDAPNREFEGMKPG